MSAANQLPLLSKSDPPKLKLTGKKRKKMQGEKCRKQRLKLIEIIQEERGRRRRGRGEGGGGDGDGELEARNKKGQETGYVRIFYFHIFNIAISG